MAANEAVRDDDGAPTLQALKALAQWEPQWREAGVREELPAASGSRVEQAKNGEGAAMESQEAAGLIKSMAAEPALRLPDEERAKPLAFRLASMPPPPPPGSVSPLCARGQVYPPPLATHEQVSSDPALFMDALCKFHEAMGSRMASPRMGGNQLDLYRLYLEVTSRGGLEQVMKERLWKDIKAVFNFPRTTTSASFVLRKYYTSLLHHFEQVYFFRVQGPLVPPPAPLPAPSPARQSPENVCAVEEPERTPKRKTERSLEVDPGAAIGQTVTGSIQEKFEHGYLVTVAIGSDRFRGVIYHVPDGSCTPQFTSMPGLMTSAAPGDTAPHNVGLRLRRKRRKLGLRKRDPTAPKLNRSGYNFFFAEQRAKLKLVYQDKDREISKRIGEAWSSMTEEQKQPYQDRGVKDKERYKREMKEYRERIKLQKTSEGDECNKQVLHDQQQQQHHDEPQQQQHQGQPQPEQLSSRTNVPATTEVENGLTTATMTTTTNGLTTTAVKLQPLEILGAL